MVRPFQAALALGLAAVAGALVLANAEQHVINLTAADYAEKTADGKVWFVKYYAPWCGHCKRLAPTWEELAAALKDSDSIAIAHVDCTVEKDICSKAEVRGYPTLKVLYAGETKEQYRGARELAALKDFIEKQKITLLDETTETEATE